MAGDALVMTGSLTSAADAGGRSELLEATMPATPTPRRIPNPATTLTMTFEGVAASGFAALTVASKGFGLGGGAGMDPPQMREIRESASAVA